ncbi:hypothetical protein ACFFWD_37950 [Bradyrhizobium erythrophlei]|uniref:hypothetical protein n=1 Tax=Bradyrhizobium erythrophlei TaxID=1437360 RepID=UPI0035EA0619
MLDMLATFWMDLLGPTPGYYFDYGYQKVNARLQKLRRARGRDQPARLIASKRKRRGFPRRFRRRFRCAA